MNRLNILIILIILIKFNECNEIEKLKKEMNDLKQDFEYLGQQMLRRVTEFKEEAKKDMDIGLDIEKTMKPDTNESKEYFESQYNNRAVNFRFPFPEVGLVQTLFMLIIKQNLAITKMTWK